MNKEKIPLETLLGLRRFYYYCKECNTMTCSRYDRKSIECSNCGKDAASNEGE